MAGRDLVHSRKLLVKKAKEVARGEIKASDPWLQGGERAWVWRTMGEKKEKHFGEVPPQRQRRKRRESRQDLLQGPRGQGLRKKKAARAARKKC